MLDTNSRVPDGNGFVSWSTKEDLLLLSLYKDVGSNWRVISQALNGRSVASIRNRFQRIQHNLRLAMNRNHDKIDPNAVQRRSILKTDLDKSSHEWRHVRLVMKGIPKTSRRRTCPPIQVPPEEIVETHTPHGTYLSTTSIWSPTEANEEDFSSVFSRFKTKPHPSNAGPLTHAHPRVELPYKVVKTRAESKVQTAVQNVIKRVQTNVQKSSLTATPNQTDQTDQTNPPNQTKQGPPAPNYERARHWYEKYGEYIKMRSTCSLWLDFVERGAFDFAGVFGQHDFDPTITVADVETFVQCQPDEEIPVLCDEEELSRLWEEHISARDPATVTTVATLAA